MGGSLTSREGGGREEFFFCGAAGSQSKELLVCRREGGLEERGAEHCETTTAVESARETGGVEVSHILAAPP